VRGQRHVPAATYPWERPPVPIVQEAGWASGPVWTGAENLAPSGLFFMITSTRTLFLPCATVQRTVQKYKCPVRSPLVLLKSNKVHVFVSNSVQTSTPTFTKHYKNKLSLIHCHNSVIMTLPSSSSWFKFRAHYYKQTLLMKQKSKTALFVWYSPPLIRSVLRSRTVQPVGSRYTDYATRPTRSHVTYHKL